MKHRFTFFLTYACIALFGSLGLLLLLFGKKDARPSDEENRMLAGFPALSGESLKSGAFMEGIESYLSDAMPGRNRIVAKTASWMNALSPDKANDAQADADVFEAVEQFGGDEPDEPEAPSATPEPTAAAPAPTETPAPTDPETPAPTDPEPPEQTATPAPDGTGSPSPTDPGAAGTPRIPREIETCTFRQVRADGTYRTTYTFERERVDNAIRVLNAYRRKLPENGHVFFTQVPFPDIAFTLQRGDYAGWECDLEAIVAANVDDGVEVISAPDVLEPGLLAGEDLYFKTDHHWKPRAACEVAQAMLKRIGIDALGYDDYTYHQNGGWYGSRVSGHPELKKTTEPDTVEVLIPTLPVRGVTIDWNGTEKPCPFMVTDRHSYLAYLGGTLGPWRRYETGVDCGRKALVIGDSYICCFVPYLAPYYEEVHTTDLRKDYYDASHAAWTISDYLERNEIDDVYIVLSTASGVNAAYVTEYLWKYL